MRATTSVRNKVSLAFSGTVRFATVPRRLGEWLKNNVEGQAKSWNKATDPGIQHQMSISGRLEEDQVPCCTRLIGKGRIPQHAHSI